MKFVAGKNGHMISGVFAFLLLGVFAVLSTLLVVFGAQAYRGIVDQTALHNDSRISQAFVRNAISAADSENSIAVADFDGVSAFVISDEEIGYKKYIYVYDGALRELFISEEREFNPEQGEEICEAKDMRICRDGNVVVAEIADLSDQVSELTIALRCGD